MLTRKEGGNTEMTHKCADTNVVRIQDAKPEANLKGYVVMEFDFSKAGPDQKEQFLQAQLMIHSHIIREWPLHRFKDVLLYNIGEGTRKAFPVLGRATYMLIDLSTFKFTFLRIPDSGTDCQG